MAGKTIKQGQFLRQDWTIDVSGLAGDSRRLLGVNIRAITNDGLSRYRWNQGDILGVMINAERERRGMPAMVDYTEPCEGSATWDRDRPEDSCKRVKA